MPRYEAFVTGNGRDGLADVVIQPGCAGIPGAPNVNVCHAPTGSSRISARAVNEIGASAGDLVMITSKSGAFLKNAAILIGFPLIGLLAGLIAGAAIESWSGWGTALAVAAGLLLGIGIAAILYRKTAGDTPLIITEVLARGVGGSASFRNAEGSTGSGQGCSACVRG